MTIENITTGNITLDSYVGASGTADNSFNYILPMYPYQLYYYNDHEDKTGKAFKIVQKLIEKKLVKSEKIQDFVNLVNEISEIIN